MLPRPFGLRLRHRMFSIYHSRQKGVPVRPSSRNVFTKQKSHRRALLIQPWRTLQAGDGMPQLKRIGSWALPFVHVFEWQASEPVCCFHPCCLLSLLSLLSCGTLGCSLSLLAFILKSIHVAAWSLIVYLSLCDLRKGLLLPDHFFNCFFSFL